MSACSQIHARSWAHWPACVCPLLLLLLPLSVLSQYLVEAGDELNDRLTAAMLDSANQKCFRMCFHNGTPGSNTAASASAIGSSVSREQQQCITNCLDKFLEAREIAYKKIANM